MVTGVVCVGGEEKRSSVSARLLLGAEVPNPPRLSPRETEILVFAELKIPYSSPDTAHRRTRTALNTYSSLTFATYGTLGCVHYHKSPSHTNRTTGIDSVVGEVPLKPRKHGQ